MTVVVSDASPLNILIRLECAEVLPALFGVVWIPAAVREELTASGTPDVVREWIDQPRPWLQTADAPERLPGDAKRHRGEREAMALAIELGADLILLDDLEARRAALELNLRITGTIGVLEAAANAGHIENLAAVHAKLRETDFHASDRLLQASLDRHLQHGRTEIE